MLDRSPTHAEGAAKRSQIVFLLFGSYQLFSQRCSTSPQYSPSTSAMPSGQALEPATAEALVVAGVSVASIGSGAARCTFVAFGTSGREDSPTSLFRSALDRGFTSARRGGSRTCDVQLATVMASTPLRHGARFRRGGWRRSGCTRGSLIRQVTARSEYQLAPSARCPNRDGKNRRLRHVSVPRGTPWLMAPARKYILAGDSKSGWY